MSYQRSFFFAMDGILQKSTTGQKAENKGPWSPSPTLDIYNVTTIPKAKGTWILPEPETMLCVWMQWGWSQWSEWRPSLLLLDRWASGQGLEQLETSRCRKANRLYAAPAQPPGKPCPRYHLYWNLVGLGKASGLENCDIINLCVSAVFMIY